LLKSSTPLLWHFENTQTLSERGEGSIELSLDEVKELARKVGFELSVSSNLTILFQLFKGIDER